jgi:hypothetical protein
VLDPGLLCHSLCARHVSVDLQLLPNIMRCLLERDSNVHALRARHWCCTCLAHLVRRTLRILEPQLQYCHQCLLTYWSFEPGLSCVFIVQGSNQQLTICSCATRPRGRRLNKVETHCKEDFHAWKSCLKKTYKNHFLPCRELQRKFEACWDAVDAPQVRARDSSAPVFT